MYMTLSRLAVLAAILAMVVGNAGAALVAHYPLDEGEGTTTADASGNGHTGTIEGTPTWVDGQPGLGKALFYKGENPADGRVNCGTWNPSAGTGELTVAFWAKWNGPIGPSNWQGVVANERALNGLRGTSGFRVLEQEATSSRR